MVGQRLAHYTILEEIGRGGMGVVYKARDTKLDRTVAIKLISESVELDEHKVSRLRSEARTASGLNHPNILTIHDIGFSDERTYIVMEWVEGRTLRDVLADGPVAPETVLDIGSQVASGLAAAHRNGVIHRDIKPENLILLESGLVKIMDFGLAKSTTEQTLTVAGHVVGTSAYMSPEQLQGSPLTGATDVWSLGVVMYEMVSGSRPFEGEYLPALVYSIVNVDPKCPPGLEASALWEIIRKCLEKIAEMRFEDCSNLASELGGIHRGSSHMRDGLDSRSVGRGWSRIPTVLAIGFGLALVVSLFWWSPWSEVTSSGPELKKIAILRFRTTGSDPVEQSMADGLLHSITSRVIGTQSLQSSITLIPASEIVDADLRSVREARDRLGIDIAVTGSLERFEEAYRLSLDLIDAGSITGFNSITLNSTEGDLLAFPDEAAVRIMGLLPVPASNLLNIETGGGGTRSPVAFDDYLKGQGALLSLHVSGNVDLALRLFDHAIQEDSTYAEAYAGLGEASWRKYELTQDTSWVTQAVRMSDKAVQLNPRVGAAHSALGLIYRRTNRFELAVSAYQHALDIEPNNAVSHMGLGKALHGLGRDSEGLPHYEKAIALRPDLGIFRLDLGLYHLDRSELEQAASQFEKTIELSPENPYGYNNLAAIRQQQGQWSLAAELYEQSIAVRPIPFAFQNLASIYYFNLKDYREAANVLERGLAVLEDDYSAWSQLGNAYYWAPGNRDKAGPAWERALQLARLRLSVVPNDTDALTLVAESSYLLGNSDIGINYVDSVMYSTRAQPSADDFYFAAKMYEYLGQRDSALKFVELALPTPWARDRIQDSPWLELLRESPEYKLLLEKTP